MGFSADQLSTRTVEIRTGYSWTRDIGEDQPGREESGNIARTTEFEEQFNIVWPALVVPPAPRLVRPSKRTKLRGARRFAQFLKSLRQ